jgi:hydroxyacylglutathione hydrolase
VERATNPFLRSAEPAIGALLASEGRMPAGAPPLAVFTALRQWKNNF